MIGLGRWEVYQISAAVAGISYGAVLILLNIGQLIRRQWQINTDQAKTDHEIVDIIRRLADASHTADDKIIDILRSLANSLHTTNASLAAGHRLQQLQTELDKAREGGLPKLLGRIKGLFGDL